MHYKKAILFCLILFLPYPVLAKVQGYFGAAAGIAIAKIGSTQDVGFLAPHHNTYVSNSARKVKFQGGINGGILFPIAKELIGSFGIGIYQDTPFTANGDVYQFGDPNWNNTDYSYKLMTTRLMAEMRFFLGTAASRVLPYLSVGIGSAWNRTYDYHENPKDSHVVPPRPFANKTTTSLAYQFGAGIDFALTEHWRLGTEYRYEYWGKGRLGLSPDQNVNDNLTTGKIRTHNIYCRITYII